MITDKRGRHVAVPQDAEIEGLLCMAAIIDPDAIDRLTTIPTGDDFWFNKEGAMWEGILRMHQRGAEMTDESLLHEANQGEDWNYWEADDLIMLRVNYGDVDTTKLPEMVEQLLLLRTKRRVIALASELVRSAYNDDRDTMLTHLERQTDDILNNAAPSSLVTFQEAARQWWDDVDEVRAGGQDPRISTGLADLDAYLGGAVRGRLLIVAGRPGSGKSALGLQLALTAEYAGNRVGIFSLEMQAKEIAARAFAMKHGIPTSEHYEMTDEQFSTFTAWALDNEKAIWFDEAEIQNVAQIVATCRYEKRVNGLDYVVVDFLQLIDVKVDNGQNTVDAIGKVTRALARLAKALNIVVVLCCQLNRQSEYVTGYPKKSWLRGSGRIEEDAYQIVILHTPDDEETNDDAKPVGAYVVKNRAGPEGLAELTFRRKRTLFTLRSRPHQNGRGMS